MKLYNVKLLTVTCEILAQKNVFEILTKHNITGYTTYEVEGSGARGLRGQGLKNEKNVKVEVIMQENTLQDVVEEIARTLFTNFTIILYVSEVGVLRTEKFV
jgi:nitrogen regulatory protein PII